MMVYSINTKTIGDHFAKRVNVVKNLVGSYINGYRVDDFRYHPASGRLHLFMQNDHSARVVKATIPGRYFASTDTLGKCIADAQSA